MSHRALSTENHRLEDVLRGLHDRLWRLENPMARKLSTQQLQLGEVLISVQAGATPNGQDVVFLNLLTGTRFIISI